MAYLEQVAERTTHSLTLANSVNPQQRRLVSSLRPLHYDSGAGFERIDMTPVRVTLGQWLRYPLFDGWIVPTNGWTYGLGVDGWVYFGGRRGANYLRFRLTDVGYYNTATGQWSSINTAAANYALANLSQTTGQQVIDGTTYTSSVVATWANLFVTPGGGALSLRFVADGQRLKAEYVINAAARTWIAANRPPSFYGIPAANAYLGFKFAVDWSDIPKVLINGLLQGGTFDDSAGGVELRDLLDNLIAFMPVEQVYAGVDEARQGVRLTKRFVNGNLYMGAPVLDMAALPVGDLTIDPTLTPSVGASSDDAAISNLSYNDTRTWIDVGGVSPSPLANYGQGWRFTNITLSSSDTVNSAKLTMVKVTTEWKQVKGRFTCIAEDNTATFSSGSPPGSRAITTNIAVYNVNVNRVDGTAYDFPESAAQATLGAAVQEVVDRAGWSSGNALAVVCNSAQDAGAYLDYSSTQLASYDHATYASPLLTIDYTAGSSTESLSISGAITPTGAFTARANVTLSGSLAPSGTLTLQTITTFSGAITPTGADIQQAQLTASGGITPSGSLAQQVATLLAGGITPSGLLNISQVVFLTLAGSLTPSGVLTQQVRATLSGLLAPVGGLAQRVNTLLQGLLAPVGIGSVSTGVITSLPAAYLLPAPPGYLLIALIEQGYRYPMENNGFVALSAPPGFYILPLQHQGFYEVIS